MMIPGQWERRPSNRIAAPASAPAAASRHEPAITIKRRRELATWLEVSIALAMLLGVMFFTMWAAHLAPPS
jgi:hypothetical protein